MKPQRKKLMVICGIIFLIAAVRMNHFQYGVKERLCLQEQTQTAFSGEYTESAELPENTAACQVYYLLNLDGMKGLGHSALMLVDEEGAGQVYSYNGMQYSLGQCLLGKAGIGKMMRVSLSEEEADLFLETGNLETEDAESCDNFDRTLYRYITRAQYDKIVECAEIYRRVGDEYETLYAGVYTTSFDNAAAQEAMNDFLVREDLPRYQIYRNNCDTVAREFLALADQNVERYNNQKAGSRPKGNFYRLYRELDWNWGYGKLGRDSLTERILEAF